ncbi:MAG: DNA repair protein RadA [Clostridiales bacterium]|nr:DNA repair protein RadA [Clostridiales bacterium]
MAKATSIFVCNQCGYESPKWLGKCPACNEWNSFYEEKILKTSNNSLSSKTGEKTKPIKLKDVEVENGNRFKTGFEELDRVLGGGLVEGSLVLLGGDPGIGKSTLILQLCDKIEINEKILYISGEESGTQIKLRADRLGVNGDNIIFLGETSMELIEEAIENTTPKLVIIDSIQTMFSEQISSAPGSVSQVRECTAKIMQMCKKKNITTVIIGHVTKEGAIAGPRVLEHMVDTVLYLEGERFLSYRILRGVKNRFGATNEIGVFEMREKGLEQVENPSSALISDRIGEPSGSVIIVALEGTRPILIELQALVTQTIYGMPRRTANGIDFNRLNLLMAVIEKNAGILLSNSDAYINIVGGIRLNEPAIDLGIVLSVISSFKNIPISKEVVVIGEVGLTGEIRNVNMIESRIKEAQKMGFKKCIIPYNNKQKLNEKYSIEVVGVKNINEAIKEAL